MDVEITVKKKAKTIQVSLSETGNWHVFNAKGALIQRYNDFDSAVMAVWLLDRNAEGGPFAIREIK